MLRVRGKGLLGKGLSVRSYVGGGAALYKNFVREKGRLTKEAILSLPSTPVVSPSYPKGAHQTGSHS